MERDDRREGKAGEDTAHTLIGLSSGDTMDMSHHHIIYHYHEHERTKSHQLDL